MNAATDHQLLRAYAVLREEAAFRELVQRYTDLVYSAALRQVNSDAIARDLTQGVFTDLARRASDILSKQTGESLAGWLHRATRYAALNHLRDTRRRRDHERQAMEQLLTNSDAPSDWGQIRPALDEALDSLDDTDREALLLRYFKNQDFRTVGRQLGLSDDAAQKRVSRAVERLREFFAKRGVSVGASGLVVFISANAVQAAPVGLAVTISAVALAGTAVTTSTIIAATTKTIAMTTLQKTLVTATVAVLAGAGIYEAKQAHDARAEARALRQQQAPLIEQAQQLQSEYDEAKKQLTALRNGKEQQQWRKEHLELLSLRGRITQLTGALRKQKGLVNLEADLSAVTNHDDADTILFSASLTNRIASGRTLVLGGWSKEGMRGYALITPTISNIVSPGEKPLTIESQVIAAPENFWNQIGWQDAKSDTRRSAISGMLTAEQARMLIDALKATEGAMISNSSEAKREDGESVGIGFSMADDTTSGALMGLDLFPHLTEGNSAVEIEIRPAVVSTNTPIHPALSPNKP